MPQKTPYLPLGRPTSTLDSIKNSKQAMLPRKFSPSLAHCHQNTTPRRPESQPPSPPEIPKPHLKKIHD